MPKGTVAFGSSHERSIDFISRNLDCPFMDSSSTKNPAVGLYLQSNQINSKAVIKSHMAGGMDIFQHIHKSEFAMNYRIASDGY